MCHVLVIEDDFLIADHIMQLVEAAGGTTFDQAATQEEAIESARLAPPSIIMSDVNLRHGTGPAAVQAIIAEHGPIPVIFVTGTPNACYPCHPPMVILKKPINERELMNTFRELAPLS
jgi:DNA-binding NarL/FixJ family response regulator